MTDLMSKIIMDASHPDTPCHDTTRQANLKKHMVHIRGLANSWDDLTDKCVDGIDPTIVMIKQVLDMLCESQSPLGITDVLCTCTYVADVCTELVKKSKEYDSDDEDDVVKIVEVIENVDKIVVMYVDYILDKNMTAICDFLFWLEYH
ncbi:hypothetical protein PO909_015475 [Leuciscus waleckii]